MCWRAYNTVQAYSHSILTYSLQTVDMQLWQAFSDLPQLSLAYRGFWCPPLTSSRLGPVYTVSWPQLASLLISLASCSLLWPGSGLRWPFYSVHTTLVPCTASDLFTGHFGFNWPHQILFRLSCEGVKRWVNYWHFRFTWHALVEGCSPWCM